MVFQHRSHFGKRPLLPLQREQSGEPDFPPRLSGFARIPFAPARTEPALDQRLLRAGLADFILRSVGVAIPPKSRWRRKQRVETSGARHQHASDGPQRNHFRTTATPLAGVRVCAFESDAGRHQLSGDGHCERTAAVDRSAFDLSALIRPGIWPAEDASDVLVEVVVADGRVGRRFSNSYPRNSSDLAGHFNPPAVFVSRRDGLPWTAGG